MTRLVARHVEEARVAIRVIRDRLLKELRARKEEGTLSEDVFDRERKALQGDVDAVNAEAAESGKEKEAELLTV